MIRFRLSDSLTALIPHFDPKRSISHLLIIVSIVITLIAWGIDTLMGNSLFTYLFGMRQVSINLNTLPFIVAKIALFQFIHGSLLHLFLNSYFLYSAGPEVEARMRRREYIEFFLFGTIFVAAALWILAPDSLTIGISGWCMALLSYLYMDLTRTRHPMANQVLIMLVINVALGLTGNISFIGHLFGALWGGVYYFLRRYL